MPASLPTVLTIAGSDCSGGAGIQADLKTLTAHGVYAASAITSLTAQNTVGVQAVHTPPPTFLRHQLESIFTDLPIQAVKTGMLPTPDVIQLVAHQLRQHGVKQLVVDPVLVATSGDALVKGDDAVHVMVRELFPLATVVTPNVPEAERLTGVHVETVADMREACVRLRRMGCANVLLKGGHLCERAGAGVGRVAIEPSDDSIVTDLLYDGVRFYPMVKPRVESSNTHGTGCTFAAAIAAQLAKGRPLMQAVRVAREYVHACIEDGLQLGSGNGPLNHMVGGWE